MNLKNNIPSLGNIDDEGTVNIYKRLNYSSSSPRNSEIIAISDIKIATAPTTDIGHTDSKEVELEVGRYNRSDMGYLHRRFTNGNRCLKRILW